jgi:hypothetical protein
MAGGEEPLMKRVILFIPILGWLACSNPLSQDDKNVVKILINEREPVGKYTIFWNGTDSNNKFVPAGNYKARLVTQSYVFEIDMTALDGTAGKSNDSTRIPILLPHPRRHEYPVFDFRGLYHGPTYHTQTLIIRPQAE